MASLEPASTRQPSYLTDPTDGFRRMRPNAIRALIPLIARPDVISFAGGVPSPATFPVEALAEIAARLIRDQGPVVLQYATTSGNRELAGRIATRLKGRGIENAAAEGVILTSGSQQALDLLARVLIDPGDVVFVELPSYIGGLASLWAAGAELRGFPLTEAGPDLDALERSIVAARAEGRRVPAIYTIPTFQNPSGITVDAPARARLIEIAERHDLVILEDDPYGEVYFDQAPPAPIVALGSTERIAYLGSSSKVLCPGLRAGWVYTNRELGRRMELAKEAADLCSSPLDHAIVGEAMSGGLIDDRLPGIRVFYAERCQAMLGALERFAPDGWSWTRPTGGLFVWMTLPEGFDTRAALDRVVAAGVAYVPGSPFLVDGSGANTLRLAFSKETPESIATGIETLCRVLQEA